MIRKKPMQLIGRFFVSLMGFFGCCEIASKVFAFPRNFDPSPPFFRGFYKRHSFKSRFVEGRNFSVCAILEGICLPKVAGLVVRWVAINVVNKFFRPTSRNEKPCKPLSIIQTVINTDSNISVWVNTPRRHSFLPSASTIDFPCKSPRIWVIIQKVADAVCCKFVFHSSIMSYHMTFVK